jgi:lysophospholipase L1-like esterase
MEGISMTDISRSLRRLAALAAIVGLVAVGARAVSAQQVSGPAARAAAAPDRWEATIAKFEAQDKVSPPPTNAIVFIGASSIVRWNLPESFPELGPKAINRGFGGSLIGDSVKYAHRVVIPYKPRIVVLYAGDNDVEANATAQEISDQFTLFDKKVHAALPNTKIVFISIKPSIRRWKWIDTIRGANAKVKDYIGKHPNLAFVDIENQMLGSDGKPNPALLVEDGLHMTPAGYKIWNTALRPLLK